MKRTMSAGVLQDRGHCTLGGKFWLGTDDDRPTTIGDSVATAEDLARLIQPARTALLLGAGAAVSSGAPTGAKLASLLAAKLDPPVDSSDLMEICGIWENRIDRRSLITALRKILGHLEPANAILSLPHFPWRKIYTTNFDELVEKSYKSAGSDLAVVRSNFDFNNDTTQASPILYKIHGCITKDVAFGDAARMLLTERDYDQFEMYQELAFRSLAFDLVSSDVLVIGQSLRDRHLRDLVKRAFSLRGSGAIGHVYLLMYENDPDRAALIEQQGIRTFTGSFERFLHAIADQSPSKLVATSTSTVGEFLPPALAPTCIDVRHSRALTPDAVRLFNGSPASYADIASGLTIKRAALARFAKAQNGQKGFFLTIIGAAGVGKTTLARSLLVERNNADFACWEHLNTFPLDPREWLRVEGNLRAAGRQGFLLIDDCTQQLPQVNRLADRLGALDRPFLRLVVTAQLSSWTPRTKSPEFFRRGTFERLGRLTETDIDNFVNLVDREPRISELVDVEFSLLTRSQRITRLRDRCNAEMYVCLKNVFGSEQLDDILLREYGELNEEEQDIYRHVSVLQAMGSKVHRQLIMRLLNIDALQLEAILSKLDGIVFEDDVKPELGLYGWSVRHDVIAGVIASFKFSGHEDLHDLLIRVIEGINPSIYLELDSARAICNTDWGIQRIPQPEIQIDLLKRLISKVPAERTPRRRLIRRYLDSRMLADAAQAIANFRRDIGQDSIIDRYGVLVLLYRSDVAPGLLNEDRIALLRQAETLALKLVQSAPYDRQNYRVLADVGLALLRRGASDDVLVAAIEQMKSVEATVLDPEFAKMRRRYEGTLRSYGADRSKAPFESDTLGAVSEGAQL